MIALHWLYSQQRQEQGQEQGEERPSGETAADWWRLTDGGDAVCWLCGLPCPAGAPSQPSARAVSAHHLRGDCRASHTHGRAGCQVLRYRWQREQESRPRARGVSVPQQEDVHV